MQFVDKAGPDKLAHSCWLTEAIFVCFQMDGYCSKCRQIENVKIRPHGCACSSGPSLFAYGLFSNFVHQMHFDMIKST